MAWTVVVAVDGGVTRTKLQRITTIYLFVSLRRQGYSWLWLTQEEHRELQWWSR